MRYHQEMEEATQPEPRPDAFTRLGFAILRRLRRLVVRTLKLTALAGVTTALLLILDTVLLGDTSLER
jgi:hypothetical protein